MSVLSAHAPRGFASPAAPLRFGRTEAAGDGSVQWLLKRNCSFAPRQLFGVYFTLCVVSLVIAAAFWRSGAPLVLPFAGLELLAVGIAFFAYAGHAADREQVVLRSDRLTVECTLGRRIVQVAFAPAWVRVEPVHGDRSLIELSGEGRNIAIGRFVRPELRRALADELRAALWRCGAHAALPSFADTNKSDN